MPCRPAARMDETSAPAVQITRGFAASHRHVLWAKGDVYVVGHQAMGPDPQLRSIRSRGRRVEIGRMIAILEERLLPSVTALGRVARNAGEYRTGKACHGVDCVGDWGFIKVSS